MGELFKLFQTGKGRAGTVASYRTLLLFAVCWVNWQAKEIRDDIRDTRERVTVLEYRLKAAGVAVERNTIALVHLAQLPAPQMARRTATPKTAGLIHPFYEGDFSPLDEFWSKDGLTRSNIWITQ